MNFFEGQKLVKQKEFGKALSIFLDLLKNEKINNDIYFYLGLIYSELNKFDKSVLYYDKYLKTDPNSISALHNLAIVKQSIGELDSAKKIYFKLIDLDKTKIRSYFGLSMLNINFLTIEHYECIGKIEIDDKISFFEKSLVNFILAKRENKNKNYKKEIEYIKNFNLHSFKSNFAYNQSSQFYYKNIINNFYNKIQFKKKNNENFKVKENSAPIFIVGLPRSGSTLIESILTSSDNKIKTCGESHVINMSVLEQVGPKIFIKDFDIKKFIFKIDHIEFKQTVLKRYGEFKIFDGKKISPFIDKSLENFLNIEMILKIFPNAKFLHTCRNPVDATISIYQAMLSELSWTHKIEDILSYVDNYKAIMNYFKSKYPKQIMEINLEQFTSQSELIGKKIYKFCNLKWNKNVLEFYKRKDLHSKTISFTQIRNKITEYDTKKYKPYTHLLEDYKNKYKWIKTS